MDLLQPIDCRKLAASDPDALLSREWLVTNGLGGYASGTVAGACTRRYHGLLIAALAARLPGYLVPRLVREVAGLPAKQVVAPA
jgi:hypothetical protein